MHVCTRPVIWLFCLCYYTGVLDSPSNYGNLPDRRTSRTDNQDLPAALYGIGVSRRDSQDRTPSSGDSGDEEDVRICYIVPVF